MKRLVIVRHAKAEKEARRGDFERRLTERGAADAVEMGRLIAARAGHPDAILASPAARALETARALAREIDFPWDEIRADKRAYLADGDTLLELLRELEDGVGAAVLVAHNPGVGELAALLARGFGEELPTCAALAVDLAVDTWAGLRRGCGSVRWYEVPSRHR